MWSTHVKDSDEAGFNGFLNNPCTRLTCGACKLCTSEQNKTDVVSLPRDAQKVLEKGALGTMQEMALAGELIILFEVILKGPAYIKPCRGERTHRGVLPP
jgi:hypothetical protein